VKARVLLVVAIVVALAIAIPFWPARLGGHTTYVSTHGGSMLPRFRPGDLAVVQPAGSYEVGDVVAYRSETLDDTVMHRIIAIEGDRYVMQGDNNDFIDPDHPTIDEIVGRQRHRIPQGGTIRSWIGKPYVLFPFLVLTIVGAGMGSRKRKKSRKKGRTGKAPPSNKGFRPVRSPDRIRTVVPAATALAATGCAIALVAAWTMPRTDRTTSVSEYKQQLAIGYSATAAPGAAYPDGTVKTGDPVFTKLVRNVNFELGIKTGFEGQAAIVQGTYDIDATVATGNGWKRTVALATNVPFTGPDVRGAAPLDLDAIDQLLAQFSTETGLDAATADISVRPHVHTTGIFDGTKVTLDNNDAHLDFRLGAGMLRLGGKDDEPAKPPLKNGGVPRISAQSNMVAIGPLELSVDTLRAITLVAFAGVFAGAAFALSAHQKRRDRGEVGAILARYGSFLVDTPEPPRAGGRTVVRMGSMRALARIADRQEELVLHGPTATGHRFEVVTDGAIYVYEVPRSDENPAPAEFAGV
jgi:signal peptidase I